MDSSTDGKCLAKNGFVSLTYTIHTHNNYVPILCQKWRGSVCVCCVCVCVGGGGGGGVTASPCPPYVSTTDLVGVCHYYYETLFAGSSECHPINKNGVAVLRAYLAEIDKPRIEICEGLGLKNCVSLEQDNKLTSFQLARDYYKQNYHCCWEDIVKLLCGFNEVRLASHLARKKDVNFERQCPTATKGKEEAKNEGSEDNSDDDMYGFGF